MKRIPILLLLLISVGCVKIARVKPSPDEIKIAYDKAMEAYTLQEYKKAGELFEFIVNNTGERKVKAKSLFYLGEIYRDLSRFGASLKAFAMACYYGIDCSENIKEIAPNADIESLVKGVAYSPKDLKPYLLYLAARKHQTAEKEKKASVLFQQIIQEYPNTIYARKARYVEPSKGEFKVGVLLPLTGPFSEIGESVKKGIEIGSRDKFIPIYSNTKGNPLLSYREAYRLIKREKISGIIGPLLSLNSFAVACLSDYVGIPLISPTATEELIDSVGNMTYILNRSLSMQAEAMVHYAMDELGIKTFSILYPATEYGEALYNRFKNEVLKKGGIIMTCVAYREGDPDFKDELQLIKKDSPEAVYIPALPGDIPLIAPQIKYFKIKAQILGADGWKSNELFHQVDEAYLNGVVLTDYPYNPTKDFGEKFNFVYQEKPDRYACLGFDAANIIGFLLRNPNKPLSSFNISLTAGSLGVEEPYSRVPFYIINNRKFNSIK